MAGFRHHRTEARLPSHNYSEYSTHFIHHKRILSEENTETIKKEHAVNSLRYNSKYSTFFSGTVDFGGGVLKKGGCCHVSDFVSVLIDESFIIFAVDWQYLFHNSQIM